VSLQPRSAPGRARTVSTYPSVAVDAFCEKGAWNQTDTVRLLTRAKELGHPIRVHADQAHAVSSAPRATPASQSISSGVMTYGGIR